MPKVDIITPSAVVQRYDVLQLDAKPKYTRQGFLTLSANFTRAGVLHYKMPDGSTLREFRPPNEVKKQDSLDSFCSAPITDLHPPEGMVTSKNASKLSIGHCLGTPSFDGHFVKGNLTVTDENSIEKIRAGQRKELSPGYTCRLEFEKGEYQGEKYDAIQRDIHYNHLAIGPSNWGRSGSEVAIRVDGDASVCYYDNNDKGDNPMSDIRIDGIGYPPESAQQAYDRYVVKRDTEVADLVKERDALKGKLDAKNKELGEVSVKLKEATSQEKLDARIQARVELETKAKKILGDDADLKGKNTREVHNEILTKLDYKVPEDADDTFVAGVFEGLVASYKHSDGEPAGSLTQNVLDRNVSNGDDPVVNFDKAAKERNERYENMWKEPCSLTTEGKA